MNLYFSLWAQETRGHQTFVKLWFCQLFLACTISTYLNSIVVDWYLIISNKNQPQCLPLGCPTCRNRSGVMLNLAVDNTRNDIIRVVPLSTCDPWQIGLATVTEARFRSLSVGILWRQIKTNYTRHRLIWIQYVLQGVVSSLDLPARLFKCIAFPQLSKGDYVTWGCVEKELQHQDRRNPNISPI